MKLSHKIVVGLIVFFWVGYFCFSAEQENINTLIDKGETLIQQKSYPAGISTLETVLSKDPNNVRVIYSLLNAYDAYTTELASQNRFEQVQSYLPKMEALVEKIKSLPESSLSEAASKSRTDREVVNAKAYLENPNAKNAEELVGLNAGRERYNEAVGEFKKRQYDSAKMLLEESIKLDPTNAYSYELLGEIANLNHDLKKAEEYYQKAFSLNPDPRVRTKFEKVKAEENVDRDQQQYEDEHFIIRYKRSGNLEGSEVREVLREAYRQISQDFGYYPRYKIPVILYDRAEYEAVAGSIPHWSAALFDGKIRLPVYGSSPDLRKLIFHELTHAFILDLSQMKCPVWLNEGLAQVEENKVHPIDLRHLYQAVHSKTLMDMNTLIFTDISKVQDQDKALLYYYESFSFSNYLVDQKGFYRMKMLLSDLAKSTDFIKAFETAFGRSFQDLADEWKRNLEQTAH